MDISTMEAVTYILPFDTETPEQVERMMGGLSLLSSKYWAFLHSATGGSERLIKEHLNHKLRVLCLIRGDRKDLDTVTSAAERYYTDIGVNFYRAYIEEKELALVKGKLGILLLSQTLFSGQILLTDGPLTTATASALFEYISELSVYGNAAVFDKPGFLSKAPSIALIADFSMFSRMFEGGIAEFFERPHTTKDILLYAKKKCDRLKLPYTYFYHK